MKSLLLSTCIAAGALASASAAFAADCGAVTIASMNWQSAEVLANVDKFILNKGYGCTADIITGDTVPTITSMVEKQEPDVAPEGWIDLLPQVVSNGVKEGKLVEVSEDGIILEEQRGNKKKKEVVMHTILFDNIKSTKIQVVF